MTKIFLDIETAPTQDEETRLEIQDAIRPPGQYKKEESIAEWMATNGAAAFDEQYRKTALDGAKGHVACIGLAVDDGPAITFYSDQWLENEAGTLADFFDALNDAGKKNRGAPLHFIGHNVLDFDLRFLFHRAVVLGVKPSPFFTVNPSQYSDFVYDTMRQWAGHRNYISLDGLCKALKIPGKGDMDGSMVWDYIKDGRISEVARYCADDVERVRQLYNRMSFAGGSHGNQ